ncbi:hypothetical protein FoTM2_009070 [Fusarium oxysporum f. sp. vasinfectum]|nr:hypothetical protein FoTM2_009070 [Fusarium oxysporum f. sp. vasinfectum]
MTFLSDEDWNKYVRRVCGAENAEHLAPVDPTSWWWPPKGMPPSLYRDVIYLRTKSFYLFHATSVLKWSLIILQILIGATLTALGSYSASNGTPITVLGAINTRPSRQVKMRYGRIRKSGGSHQEILDTRIVPSDKTIEQVVAECFELYRNAKATIAANMPATYNSSQAIVR